MTRLETSLASLRVPVMAIQSTFTNFNRQRVSLTPGQTTPYLDLLRRHVPGIRVEVVPETGHFPQLERPALTSELLASFAGALA